MMKNGDGVYFLSGKYAGMNGIVKSIFIKSNIMDSPENNTRIYTIDNMKKYAEIETESGEIIISSAEDIF